MTVRIGLVDCDSSHSVEFLKRFHHLDIAEDQWVEGGEVVAALAYPPPPALQERYDRFRPAVAGYGVPFVGTPEALIERVDAVLITSVDGGVHLTRARPYLEAGLRVFIDKPFATSLSDAQTMADLARRAGGAVWSASSLRFVPQLREPAGGDKGALTTAVVHGPSVPLAGVAMSPLEFYGIHTVEGLYAVMGAGCRSVSSTFSDDCDVVTGRWADGRTGIVLGTRRCKKGYGMTLFCERAIIHESFDTTCGYRDLLREIMQFFISGQPPVAIEETVETVAFIEAAAASAARNGAEISLAQSREWVE